MDDLQNTIITKEKIYANAKKEFYNNGYLNTTLKTIAEQSDVPPSLILYYYKSKDNLVSYIIDDFYREVYRLIVEDHRHLNIHNPILKKMVLAYIYYDIILSDENNKRFFKETREKRQWKPNYEFHKEISDTLFWACITEYNLTMTAQEFEIYTRIRSGARAAFFQYYFENEENLNLDVFDIIMYTELIDPKLIGIDPLVADNCLLKSKQLVKLIDYSALKLLI